MNTVSPAADGAAARVEPPDPAQPATARPPVGAIRVYPVLSAVLSHSSCAELDLAFGRSRRT